MTAALAEAGLSGSYDPADVTFLLTPLTIEPTGVAEKERLIQGGQRHYSEMVSREEPPSPGYMAVYHAAMDAGAARMGREVAGLAAAIARDVQGPITLASLVRAGVPLGVLLGRALRRMGRDAVHYGVSILRGRGLDHAALAHILQRRPTSGLVFVDGWTGKGAIAGELDRSLAGSGVATRLAVLADPCGRAWLAASGDDWLIPNGLLGATVSGLVSRTIRPAGADPHAFHGCMTWGHLAPHDVSRAFVGAVWPHVDAAWGQPPARWTGADRARQASAADSTVQMLASRFGVTDPNRIKPGLAEATRALLRRVPDRVLVASRTGPEVRGLLHLADQAGIVAETADLGPYRAATLIRKVS